MRGVTYYLESHPNTDLSSLTYTLAPRRSALSLRNGVFASSAEDLCINILEDTDADAAENSIAHPVHALSAPPTLLGVFTG